MSESKRNIISVTGVSGAGKDFLLKKTQDTQNEESKIEIVNAGSQLLKLLERKGLITTTTSRDELKNIIKDENLQSYIREIVSSLDSQKRYIFNGHIVTKSGDFLKFNPEIEKEINPQKYVIITADPEQIIKWREQDTSRNRAKQSPEQVDLEQKLIVSIVSAIATALNSELTILENSSNNLKDNIDYLNQI